MSANLELEKQLKLVAKTGSYVVGRREVSNSLKGTKLLVWSASANVPQLILDECKNLSVPAIKFTGNPVELGRACGIPFRVSVIALKSPGDADLSPYVRSSDYHSGVMVTPPKQEQPHQQQRTEPKSPKEEPEVKTKKETKKKESDTKPAKTKKSRKTETTEEDKKTVKKTEVGKTTSKKSTDEEESKKSTRKKKKSIDEEEDEE